MNYRHAFHAGGIADCMKHALLVWLLRAMARKPAPFAVLDTHAGSGRYDLAGDEAQRTGESRAGILRLLQDTPPALADYVDLVRSLGLYPGSPAIARALLRPGDSLMCCELHPQEAERLHAAFHGDPRVAIHRRDGWEAIGALLPPRTARRGLVLIDPPFEQPDEYDRLVQGLVRARARFPAGVLAAWYPIKHRAPVRAFHQAIRQSPLRDVVCAELLLREPLDASRMAGSGLLVAAPPFRFEAEAAGLLQALADRLGDPSAGDVGGGGDILRLVEE